MGGVLVEVGLGHVVADGGAGVGVAHGVLHVPDADAGDKSGGAEGPAQAVWAGWVGDAGSVGNPVKCAAGAGAVAPPPRASPQDRPVVRPSTASRTARRTGMGRGSLVGVWWLTCASLTCAELPSDD